MNTRKRLQMKTARMMCRNEIRGETSPSKACFALGELMARYMRIGINEGLRRKGNRL